MKVHILYESKFGNGKKLVDYLENVISEKGHEVKSISLRDIKPKSLPQSDLYIFSSPTHVGSPPGIVKKFLKKMDVPGEGKKYALMATYMDPKTKTLEKMETLIQPKGMTKASDGIKIKVNGMKGPLEEGYKEKLDGFASKIFSE
jgi:flavorubredoxin